MNTESIIIFDTCIIFMTCCCSTL